MSRLRTARRWVAAAVGGALAVPACSTAALAHEGTGHAGHASWLPVAISLAGVAVLVASVYLDANEEIDRQYADLGVLLGVAVLLAVIPLYWF